MSSCLLKLSHNCTSKLFAFPATRNKDDFAKTYLLDGMIQTLLDNHQEDMEFFNQFIEKGLIERLENALKNEFGRLSYTEAIKILEKADKSFEFVIKTAPAAAQILEMTKKKKGTGEPNRQKVGTITWEQIRVIAEDKMADLNAFKIESAMRMIAGTARSMGISVKGVFPESTDN